MGISGPARAVAIQRTGVQQGIVAERPGKAGRHTANILFFPA
jgi:hypothetical protein